MPKKVTWNPEVTTRPVWRSDLPQYCRRSEFDQKIRDFAAKFDAICHVVPDDRDPRCDIWHKWPC